MVFLRFVPSVPVGRGGTEHSPIDRQCLPSPYPHGWQILATEIWKTKGNRERDIPRC